MRALECCYLVIVALSSRRRPSSTRGVPGFNSNVPNSAVMVSDASEIVATMFTMQFCVLGCT